ncbi:MAG: hypothetical protein ABIZ80_23355, partial [Bryobacteraceae bacterium]
MRILPINGVQIPFGATTITSTSPETYWDWRGRIDHRLTAKDTLSFITYWTTDGAPVAAGNRRFGNTFAETKDLLATKQALSHTRIMNPHWINEARFGFSSYRIANENSDLQPYVTLGDFAFGRDPTGFGRVEDKFFQWQDISTFVAGRHSVKAGLDLYDHRRSDPAETNTRGTWAFDNFAGFVNNQPSKYSQVFGGQKLDIPYRLQSYFVQDDIRVRPTLNLTLGARYELRNVPNGYFGAASPEVTAVGVPGLVHPDRNNWAPRGSLAWSPDPTEGLFRSLLGNGRTVFRGGYGISYDLFGSFLVAGNAIANYPRAQSFELLRPETSNLYPRVQPRSPKGLDPLAAFSNLPETAQLPTTHFYNFAVQRQFGRDYSLEAGYAGSRSYHLEIATEHNPAILTTNQAERVIAARISTVIPASQLRRVHPEWGSRAVTETSATGRYNALYARFDKRLSAGVLIGLNYVYSCSTSNDFNVQQSGDFRLENSRNANDRPHRAVVHYAWDLPWFRSGRLASAPVRKVFGGWSLTGWSEWQSGVPFTVTTGVDSNGDTSGNDRPDYNPAGRVSLDPVTGDWRTFSTPTNGSGLFVVPLDGNARPLANSMPFGGNLGKNTFRGPGLSLWNLNLTKSMRVTEKVRLAFRGD